jgi:ankyrin repeat protein
LRWPYHVASYLAEHGARKVELDLEEAFAAACIGGRRDDVQALLKRGPNLLEQLGRHRQIELLHRAVEGDHLEGLRLMAELGFAMTGMTAHDRVGMNLNTTSLHNAAWKGNLEMVKLLLELGADPGLREPTYNGTPLDWAAHNQQEHVVEYLKNLERP